MIAALLALVLVAPARAGGFEVAQQSALAGGTGHAGTARVDAASAWFDPAALADDGGLRVALGAAFASATVDAASADATDPWQTRSDTPLGTPPHLYASFARSRLVGGVSVNTAFAGGIRWPADGPLRFESIESEPRFVRVAPFVGARFGPVRLAGGLHVDAGALRVLKATDHVVEEGTAEILLRGSGVGADASLYVAVTDKAGIGLSYKGRTRLPLHGEADFDVPDTFAARLPDQTVSADWRLPDRLALGARAELGPVRALADAVFTAWSVNDELHIVFDDPASDDVVQHNAWRNTLALRGGGETDVVEIVTLRAGAYLDGVGGPPAPEETLGPSSPDGRRIGATLGAGVGIGDIARVDAFGEYLAVLGRTSTSPDAPQASYRGRAVVAGLTMSMAVGAR